MAEQPRSERHWRALLADEMTRNGRLYYRVAYGILRDAHAAEDACQQALCKAMPKSQELRSDELLRPWLTRVVVTESLMARRRRQLEQRTLAGQVLRSPNHADGADWSLREAVLEAVDTLTEPTRAIVVMRLLDGMSGGEVGDVLGYSDAYVSRQLHGGMALLRVALQDWKAKGR